MKKFIQSFGLFVIFILNGALLSIHMTSCDAAAKGNRYLVNIDDKGIVLDGYDPVAFFTDKRPVKGKSTINHQHHEAIYHFASDENKQLFINNPEKYAPQYGAYCGYAVSLGHLAPIDVNFFSIIDGKLILQHNQKALNGWNKDSKSLEKAEKYWPKLLAQNGKPLVPDEEKNYLVNLDDNGFIAEGYDVVAYFTENKPVKGKDNIIKLYKGAFYAFASEDNKQLFGNNPKKYMPQFGGFCAYAISINKLRPIDHRYFQFVDGRLLLQHSKRALKLFNKDVPGNTILADKNWPGLLAKQAGKFAKYDARAK